MSKRIFLSDFDGTLVNKDILDVVCGLVGKEEESRNLNLDFIHGKREGLPTLKKRIDFLEGISLEQIESLLLKKTYLMDGAKELFDYLRNQDIITVLHSGNITPVLKFYQKHLGIDYIIGTSPRIKNNIIQGIELEEFNGRNFKVDGCLELIKELNISKENIIALGDSPSDKGVFEISKTSIAINPKGDIENYSTHVVQSLQEVMTVLEHA